MHDSVVVSSAVCRRRGESIRSGMILFLVLLFMAMPAGAEVLSFENVLNLALQNCFDCDIFHQEALAAEAAVREAQSSYYPQLAVRFGNDYIHSYTDNKDVLAGSDVVIANQSSYRHSLISNLSYTLYDFGVRGKYVENARHQVKIAELQGRQAAIELSRDILRVFSSGLKRQKEIAAQTDILQRQQEVFRLSQQLQQAGTLGRDQAGSAALELAETLNRLEDLRLALQNELTTLGYYTDKSYRAESHSLGELAVKQVDEREIDLNLIPEVQIAQQKILSKDNELKMARAAMLPKLTFNALHRMFGSDVDRFESSYKDLDARDATLSLVIEWPLFSGFEGLSKQCRLRHELSSLRLQKQKIEAELRREAATVRQGYRTRNRLEQVRQKQLLQISSVNEDVARLADQQVTDQLSYQRTLVELGRKRLEQELWQVDLAVAALDLNFMQEGME